MAPRLRSGLIERPRLIERLAQGLDVPLSLIVAPAGFGKTTVIGQWLAGQARSAAWLTVDGGDADERRFVTHLVAAIAAVAPIDSQHVLELLHAPGMAPIADIGATLADDLFDLTGDLVVVLDDAHLATSPSVLSFLTHFLALIPSTVHLVLASRTDLPLSLARPRAQDLVLDIRAAELRFSDEEAGALVSRFAPAAATPATIGLLQEQSEGWVTGLRLAAQALALLPDPVSLSDLVGDRQPSMQFLIEEVLATQRVADQAFLLRTSVVERFTAPLATALLADAGSEAVQAMLDRLMHAGLFLEPAADEPGWVRYHPHFRQLLRHQLAQTFSAQAITELHQRAAAWFAGREMIDEAISHLLAAGDLDATAALVEHSYHRVLSREDWQSVARWLRLLPEELVHRRPGLLLARGWVAHLSGRAAPLRAILAEVEALIPQAGASAAVREAMHAEADVLSLATLLPIEQNPAGALQMAERAIVHLPPENRFPVGLAKAYLGLIQQTLGQEREARRFLEELAEREAEQIDAGSIRALLGLIFAQRQAANFRECANVAQHTLTIAQRHGLAITAGWAEMFLGWMAYERNDLDVANAHFAAVANDYRRMHVSCVRESMFGMALVFQAQGRAADADATMQRLTEIIIDATALEHLPSVQGFEARLALLRQQTDVAARWLATADVTINSNTFYAFEHALLTQVKTLLDLATPDGLDAAAGDLAVLRERAERTHHRARLVEILALSALLHETQGRSDEALAAVHQALILVKGGPFYRTFLDLGSGMVELLRRAAPDIQLPAPLSGLLHAPPAVVEGTRPAVARTLAVLELLTLRECDVLERLGRRLSYQEIADELFISPGTVKRHIGNIYSKLDAGNRREALVRAQALGWQPEP